MLDASRETIAKALNADFRQIIFTASATEANNLALRGVTERAKASGIERPRIIISQIEHESVLETARKLEKNGVEVIYLAVNREGIIDLEVLQKLLNERTVLVSVMYANNEIGTIEPIREIGKIVSTYRGIGVYPMLHTDAVQAFQFLDCDVNELRVDLMTISGHKIYGPKGVGVLYIRSGKQEKKLEAIVTGGGQEYGLRSGTENVPAIVGLVEAVKEIQKVKKKNAKKISTLKLSFWNKLNKILPKTELNGVGDLKSTSTLPNILNVYFSDRLALDLLMTFDRIGIMASAGSACSMRSLEPSYVIQALGHSRVRAESSIRFSFGALTTRKDILDAVSRIKAVIK